MKKKIIIMVLLVFSLVVSCTIVYSYSYPKVEEYVYINSSSIRNSVMSYGASNDEFNNLDYQLPTVSQLDDVETVFFNGNDTSMNGLEQARNLKRIRGRLGDVTDLGPVAKMNNLEIFESIADGQNQAYNDKLVSDVFPLSKAEKLKEIQIDCSSIEDLSVLSSLKELKRLQINNNVISLPTVYLDKNNRLLKIDYPVKFPNQFKYMSMISSSEGAIECSDENITIKNIPVDTKEVLLSIALYGNEETIQAGKEVSIMNSIKIPIKWID